MVETLNQSLVREGHIEDRDEDNTMRRNPMTHGNHAMTRPSPRSLATQPAAAHTLEGTAAVLRLNLKLLGIEPLERL